MSDSLERAFELFSEVCDLPETKQTSFLREQCGDDELLLHRVQDLLDVDQDHEGPFARTEDEREAPDTQPSRLLERLAKHMPKESRYSLKGEVARGGMGAVLKVWDNDLRRMLAMKVTLGSVDRDEHGMTPPVDTRTLGRFLEEAQVTGQLDHPGIVPVHELGVDGSGQVYFTMRLIKGKTLAEVIQLVEDEEEGWTQTRALGVILKVCEALSYAHSIGVIHRDLKPSNVMVGRFGEVYVMDWGVAKVAGAEPTRDLRPDPSAPKETVATERTDEKANTPETPLLTMDGEVIGTPAYMSPEQARGEVDQLDHRTDVYGVGAMLYHLLARQTPYVPAGQRPGAHAVWRSVLNGPPAPVHSLATDVAAELGAICEMAMARDADDRYQSMSDLEEDLRAYLELRVVHAYRTGPVAEFRNWVKRNRLLAVTAISSVLIILIGTTASSMKLTSKNKEIAIREREAIKQSTRVLQLSDAKKLLVLEEEAGGLWPALPENSAALREWLARAAELENKLSLHRRTFQELSDSASDSRTFEAEWHAESLASLITGIEKFVSPSGWQAKVESRSRYASTVEERSVSSSAASQLWRNAIDSIAADTLYVGLQIEPQLDLLPIGKDPHSGLWEFAHLQTGTVAQRDTDGELQKSDDMGIVFVLVPGGEFRIGTASEARGTVYNKIESPQRQGTLDAFFLSKYELTQGQWKRFAGDINPSHFPPDPSPSYEYDYGSLITLSCPVEFVSWDQCSKFSGRLGLQLPTEAQWEYAARAGSSARWVSGDSSDELDQYANLRDKFARIVFERSGGPGFECEESLNDGYSIQAPVGSFAPNAFGLHDMCGNVSEWCRDAHLPYDLKGVEFEPGDAERIAPSDWQANKMNCRGGDHDSFVGSARHAERRSFEPSTKSPVIGVRLSRPLLP